MLNRREILGLIPASSLACLAASRSARGAAENEPRERTVTTATRLLASPPVVQHVTTESFAVSFAVSEKATGWVEWGLSADRLDHKAFASYGGLIDASETSLQIPVMLGKCGGPGKAIFYRVAAQPLTYRGPYSLQRGPTTFGSVYRITLADPNAASLRVAVINDTHEKYPTLKKLAARIESIAPQLLVWNGDTCIDFNRAGDVQRVVLQARSKYRNSCDVAWASGRPLLFVPGNHDKRGEHARELRDCLAAGPEPGLPYNFALRQGPLALIGLDTGENRPDAYKAFGGTAAYEPYRAVQGQWLQAASKRPEIASAPFKVAFCHIPLRGRPGQNDGRSLQADAAWSGDSAQHWMPWLCAAGVQLIVSGHTHHWRVDEPCDGLPMQVVGGGPELQQATLIVLETDSRSLLVTIQDLVGKELARRVIA